MQSHKALYVDTSYLKPQARDEVLRIPGSQSSQARTKHNLNVIPRRPSPCSRVVSNGSQTNKNPRTLNFQSRTPSYSRHETTQQAYRTRKASRDGPSRDPDSPSFGILDYYTQDISPPKPTNASPCPRLVIQTDMASIAAFDFGLDTKSAHSASNQDSDVIGQADGSVSPGTSSRPQKSIPPSLPCSTRKTPIQSLSKPLPSTPTEPSYTLFPKEPITPVILKTDNESLPPTPTSINTTASLPPLDTNLPTRPRKASLAASTRSRAESLSTLLPPLTFTPQRRKASTGTSNQHTSITSSPPSRWSGDTATSEQGCGVRYSEAEAQSPQWPQSFFEDDDDEDVPLRRKVVERFKRSGVRETSGEWGNGNAWGKEKRSWKAKACGCLGKRK